MHIGLHQTEHVDQFEVGRLGIFIKRIVNLPSSVGDVLPFFQHPLGPTGQPGGFCSAVDVLVKLKDRECIRSDQFRFSPGSIHLSFSFLDSIKDEIRTEYFFMISAVSLLTSAPNSLAAHSFRNRSTEFTGQASKSQARDM